MREMMCTVCARAAWRTGRTVGAVLDVARGESPRLERPPPAFPPYMSVCMSDKPVGRRRRRGVRASERCDRGGRGDRGVEAAPRLASAETHRPGVRA